MVLSKRERYIVYGTLVALAILLLDRFVLTPVEARKKVVEQETRQKTVELERVHLLNTQEKELEPKWHAMLEAGLNAKPTDAESQVLHAVRNWSQESGLSLSSLRPERGAERDQLLEMTFSASGTGTMNAVAGFLWRLESSAMPIRIIEIQLGTRKEGTDDLSLQLRISALCQTAGPESAPRKTPTPPPAALASTATETSAPTPPPAAPAPTTTETSALTPPPTPSPTPTATPASAPTPTETPTPTPSQAPAPDSAAAPDATPAPDTAPASEATADTDAPPDADTTPAPETPPSPETTPTEDTTPAPDVAPAPDGTPAPAPNPGRNLNRGRRGNR